MTVDEVMAELKAKGDEKLKKLLVKHGIKEPFFGVKIEYLKVIQKKIKKDYTLSKQLYATGNADAQYLAGLIADDKQMTKEDLRTWQQQALSNNIAEYTVPWVAAEGRYGYELALEWIDSPEDKASAMGWNTLSHIVALTPDNELDLPAIKNLLKRIIQTIHSSPNRTRYTMNGFIIAVGSYIPSLTAEAIAASEKNGVVMVDMGDTNCKVPDAFTYINKIEARGSLGKKKKTVKC
jgi:hypothetical protein